MLIVLGQTHDQVQIRPIRLWSQGAVWKRKTLESRLYVDGWDSICLGDIDFVVVLHRAV